MPNKQLIKYVRDKRGSRIGVLLAIGKDLIGWSKLHCGLDRWDREKGLDIAYGRAINGSNIELPTIIKNEMEDFTYRAGRYFKNEN